MKICVIMAGGVGSRFWPVSRRERPKQFLDILGTGRTFLQATWERMRPLADDVVVVTNASYRDLVMEQLPGIDPSNVLGEPVGRNTAPCAAWAAHHIAAKWPGAEMIVTPADHMVVDTDAFRATVSEALECARRHDAMVTIGIKPTNPNTGYGYIQAASDAPISRVKTFTEKPDPALAQAFVESGEFLWNSGIFIFNERIFAAALRKHLPEMAEQFDALNENNIEAVYSACRAVSIDIGIMEKADNVWVCTGEFGWSDMGSWNSLWEHSPRDEAGNAAPSDALLSNTTECLIRVPEGRVAVVEGLNDFIVVESGNVLLICPRAQEQDVKRLVEELKFRDVKDVI